MINKWKTAVQKHHLFLAVTITTGCCALAFVGAFALRFDFGPIPDAHLTALYLGLPIIVAVRMIALLAFKVHRGLYRYASLHDFVLLFKAVSLGSIVFLAIWSLAFAHHIVMPRSIYLLEWVLSMSALMGVRIAVRLWRIHFRDTSGHLSSSEAVQVLMVGAGSLGESVLRMVDRRFSGREMHVVGFVDDDHAKQRTLIHGIPMLGHLAEIPDVVREHDVKTLLFAIKDPPPGLFEGVVAGCAGLDVKFQVVSVLEDAFTGEVSIGKMRDLKIEDLLGRTSVKLDNRPVQESMAGKTVMITGAGGSIGSELSRQIASFAPERIILFDAAESPLFEIDRELRQFYPDLNIMPVIGDIKHVDVVNRVFDEMRPHLVYHAAAYKHVPLMEAHPDEAILNNVQGTRHLAEAACRFGCERFVMISTDKAVRPTNVMGASKRLCELVIQSRNGGHTICSTVRFGNVLGSNGSVIPIFQKQIEAGGPLTVTHPEMTRYFMTIPEAVSLVLQCGSIAEAGDIFVLDMGTPMKIMDLARNMIRLSGLREEVDISIEVTGLRPGEKMYEELVSYGENLEPTSVPKVNVLKKSDALRCGQGSLILKRRMEEIAEARNVEEVRRLLWEIIDIDVKMSKGEADCSQSCMGGGRDESDCAPVASVDAEELPVKGQVLAVAYQPDDEDGLRSALRAEGYECRFVDAMDVAIKLIVSETPYSAIFCNYSLPSGTIWKFREKLGDMGVEIPLIATTACDAKSRLEQLRNIDPAIHQLRKPFLADRVRAAPVS